MCHFDLSQLKISRHCQMCLMDHRGLRGFCQGVRVIIFLTSFEPETAARFPLNISLRKLCPGNKFSTPHLTSSTLKCWTEMRCNIDLNSSLNIWRTCYWLYNNDFPALVAVMKVANISFHTASQLGHSLCNNLNLKETGKTLIVDCINPHIFGL